MIEIFNNAPKYMTIFSIFSSSLPFFLYLSIYQAKKKNIKIHFISQSILLGLTLLFVIYFEIMVRMYGGFLEFSDNSLVPYSFLIAYLFLHIIIASSSLGGWIYLYISSLKAYLKKDEVYFHSHKHKRIGIAIFMALTVNSIMGLLLHVFLFFRN